MKGIIAATLAACLTASAAHAQWQNAGPGSVGTTAPASTATAGVAKCDGVTTTCAADGTITATTGGTAGINQLTGDGTAGPASGSAAITVSKIGGKALTLGGALTTTGGASGTTLAFPTTGTFTFPAASATLASLAGSEVLTNKTINCADNTCTVRIGSDVSGLGTNVATALAVNVGTAGAFLKNNGDALSGTYSGNFTLSGTPTMTGLGAGTIAECAGFATASNVMIRAACSGGGGSGTVTSVTLGVPASSIFGTSGTNPVTTSGTFNITTTGSSGGIPYFSSGTQLSSSAALPAGQIVLGGGAGAAPNAMSAISGDGSLDTSTGIVTITSTNGTPFAASATLDTTNATNIGSGTLDGARLPNTVNQCPSDIDTWNGVLDKTISSTVGFVYTTGSTQIAAPRTLTLPIVAGHGISTCPLVFMDLARIVNSTGTVVPTRQSTDTIDGNTTGTTMACAGQTSAWTAPVAASWGTVAPPTLCSDTVVTGQYLTVINDNGTVGRAQVNFNQLAGTATGAQLPAATTSTQGAALLHNVPFSMGWNSATNPDGNFVAVVTQASRITAIKGRIGPAVGATAAITVKKAASAVDCAASGTPLHTGTFDANGTANTVQTLTLVGGATDDLAVNDTVCFSTANGAAFLAGVGKGVISIDWAPL